MKSRIINKDYWLFSKPIAHRGLWGNGIIENSLTAYKNAVEKGYPIEIDLYLTTDNKLVSFHDKTLIRMTGAEGFIYDKSLIELKKLRLSGSEEQIPEFKEILEIVNGKVPLLIEIKNQPNKTVVEEIIKTLKNYEGEFAIQSFNPLYIKKVKKLAPEFIRGILATEEAKEEKPFTRFIVKRMPLNFLAKPDFISYHYKGIPKYAKTTKKMPVISWTLTSQEDYEKIKPNVKNIIFENFVPNK